MNDPDLGTGLVYMVNDADYAAHLKETARTTSDGVVSACWICLISKCTHYVLKATTCGSDLHAINQAYTRNSKGYIVTGVVAVSCCHSFLCPTSVVDLQKGEK